MLRTNAAQWFVLILAMTGYGAIIGLCVRSTWRMFWGKKKGPYLWE